MPGNEGRNYVIRRILRRGILYGTKLGLKTGFFEQLVAPVVESLGIVFPELKERQDIIRRVIRSEEESFGRTLERGLAIFNKAAVGASVISGALAFELYDTYGFPLDMTQLLATERGLTVDTVEFERLMEEQRNRGRASTKKEIVVAATEGADAAEAKPTPFIGYVIGKSESFAVTVTEIVRTENDTYLVFDRTPFYAEMGGQLGDCGVLLAKGHAVQIGDTIKDKAGRHLHLVSNLDGHLLPSAPRGAQPVTAEFLQSLVGHLVEAGVNMVHRRAIQRHHSATHLLNFALRRVLGTHVRQAGSLNAPDRMRFDFAHFEAVTPAQLHEIEHIVNWRILDNAEVKGYETDFDTKPKGTLAFFGEKYGKRVRVVDIGGYSRELCGGTHVNTTGEIGLFKIVSEGAVAAGTRRIEAVAGHAAFDHVAAEQAKLVAVAGKIGVPVSQLDLKLDSLLAQKAEVEKKLKVYEQRAAAALATELAAKAVTKDGLPHVSAVVTVDAPEALREIGSQVLNKLGGEGVVVIGAAFGPEKLSLVAFASPAAIKAGHQAGKIISALTAQLGGKGGGKPDFAMGGGKDVAKLTEVLGS
jgi:alanyl-tRNA synthetase